jgi:hypothetical protein
MSVTYRDCLWTLAINAGLNPDPAASDNGVTNVKNIDRSQWTQYLNDAIDYVWTLDPFSIFPWIAKAATPTVTNNTFQLSDIEYAEFWTAWRVDPRTYFKANASTYPSTFFFRDLERLRLGSALDTDQATVLFHTVVPYDTATSGDVTVFYRAPVPQWTWTPVSTTTTYNTVGTLVYGGDTDGNVYKSIATGALGSALTDTAKWTPVTIPNEFRKLVIAEAERRRIAAKSPAKSEGDMDYQLGVIANEEDILLQKADLSQKAAPWLRRSYEDPNSRSH